MERDEHILLIVYIRCLNNKYLDRIFRVKGNLTTVATINGDFVCVPFHCNLAISQSYFALHNLSGLWLCNKTGLYFEKYIRIFDPKTYMHAYANCPCMALAKITKKFPSNLIFQKSLSF